ncbi:MAG: nucleic acid-binding protein, contains PIN domain [Halanaerobium sp.]|nr:MAG: nucleic acid-binding protein, contains PIN domain [Halanaerobium sp.]PUU95722.1 MAG: nucleic acid-binding protein, contains PIN domain [Halanaerobium sp.]
MINIYMAKRRLLMNKSNPFLELKNKSVFVDTSAWFALLNKKEQEHAKIKEIYQALLENNNTLIISNQVLGETFTLLRYRIKNNEPPFKFIELINKSMMIKKVFVEEKFEKEALKILKDYQDQKFSYVDATSFAVMNGLELKYALSLDTHFAAAGFIIP